jgi:hypothetical protein
MNIKVEVPSSNPQVPRKLQNQNSDSNSGLVGTWELIVGSSLELVGWNLEFTAE